MRKELLYLETKKILNTKYMIAYCIIYIMVLAAMIIMLRSVRQSEGLENYQEIYEQFEGPISDDKINDITEYRDYVNSIIVEELSYDEKYRNKDITVEEYNLYRDEFHRCRKNYNAINELHDYVINNKIKCKYIVFKKYLYIILNPSFLVVLMTLNTGLFIIFLFREKNRKIEEVISLMGNYKHIFKIHILMALIQNLKTIVTYVLICSLLCRAYKIMIDFNLPIYSVFNSIQVVNMSVWEFIVCAILIGFILFSLISCLIIRLLRY